MTRRERLPEDQVVQEVRQARAKLWKMGGGTIEGFIRIVEQQAGPRPARRGKAKRNA